jgi:predicted nucleotidyltransferase component of viral defense system
LDVNFGERAYLPAEERAINAPYSDLQRVQVPVRTLALGEILGNKWYMLDDRDEPRDLYDLWSATTRFAVPFEEIALGHLAKYGYLPDERNLRTAQKLSKLWEQRLAHQVFPLPDFDEVLAELSTAFEESRASLGTAI